MGAPSRAPEQADVLAHLRTLGLAVHASSQRLDGGDVLRGGHDDDVFVVGVSSRTTPEAAGRFIAEEAKRLSRVIKTKGITAN